MTGRTHDLAAFTALNLVAVYFPVQTISLGTAVFALGACFLGGLAPDIDQPAANFWQRLPAGRVLGKVFSNLFWRHRTVSHSIVGIFVFWLISYFIGEWMKTFMQVDVQIIQTAFLVGVISHIVADTFTQEGVPWFFPFNWYVGIPPVAFLRMNTGGNLEKYFLFPALLGLNVYLFWKNYTLYLDLFHKMF